MLARHHYGQNATKPYTARQEATSKKMGNDALPWAKRARLSLKMTQQQFADALEVHRTTVVQWEKPGGAEPGDLAKAAIEELLATAKQKTTEPDTPEPDPPKLAGVNITYGNSETLVAVRLAHQEFAAQQNAQSWEYSVKVVRLVLESIGKAFDGAPPATINGARLDASGKRLPDELKPKDLGDDTQASTGS